MRHVVIHIGANKTASTTLQRALFSKHDGLHYMGEDAVGYEGYASIVNSMVNDDDLYFPFDECAELFNKHLREDVEKTMLYSNEDVMTSRIPKTCARRLHDFLPDAEILLVVRNQYTAIPSFYANHGAFLKPAPPSYFRRHVSIEDWIRYQVVFIKYGALASFMFNRLLSVYAELFGEQRIHVLLFEEFVENKQRFIEKLSDVLRINSNEASKLLQSGHERKRYTNRMLAYNKLRTSFFWGVPFSNYLPFGHSIAKQLSEFLSAGDPAKVVLSNEIRQVIYGLYCEDNAALAAKYNLPLAQYGYPIKH
jgi:hypothetical protein